MPLSSDGLLPFLGEGTLRFFHLPVLTVSLAVLCTGFLAAVPSVGNLSVLVVSVLFFVVLHGVVCLLWWVGGWYVWLWCCGDDLVGVCGFGLFWDSEGVCLAMFLLVADLLYAGGREDSYLALHISYLNIY